MRTCAELALAVESLLRRRLDHVFSPCQKLIHGHLAFFHILRDARLYNRHRHPLDFVPENRRVPFQRSQCVKHHLRIALRLYDNALTVLVVRDVQGVAADDDAVAGTKALRHIVGQVNSDFHVDVRHPFVPHADPVQIQDV